MFKMALKTTRSADFGIRTATSVFAPFKRAFATDIYPVSTQRHNNVVTTSPQRLKQTFKTVFESNNVTWNLNLW